MYTRVAWVRRLVLLTLWLPLFACADARPIEPATTSPARPAETRWVAFEAREISVAFPYILGDFKYEGTARFSEPALGVTLRYSSGEAFLNLYIYKGGASSIPDGVQSDLVRQQFVTEQLVITTARLFGELGRAGPQAPPSQFDLRGRPDRAMRLGANPNAVPMLVKEFDLVPSQGQQWRTVLWLTGFRGHLVKVRATYPMPDPTESADRLWAVQTALGQLLQDEGRRQSADHGLLAASK
jgi:hypothetical protein